MVTEKWGNRYSGRDEGDSDMDKAGDTVIPAGRKAVDGNVLEPRSAKEHCDHQAILSPGHARRDKGEYADGVVG